MVSEAQQRHMMQTATGTIVSSKQPIKKSSMSSSSPSPQQGVKRRRFQRRNSQNAQMMMASCKQCVVEIALDDSSSSSHTVRVGGTLSSSFLFQRTKKPKQEQQGGAGESTATVVRFDREQAQRLCDTALQLIDGNENFVTITSTLFGSRSSNETMISTGVLREEQESNGRSPALGTGTSSMCTTRLTGVCYSNQEDR